MAKKPKPQPGVSAIKVSLPPYSPYDVGLGNAGEYLAHVRFGEGYVYGVIPVGDTLEVLQVRTGASFRDWLAEHVQDLILPEVEKWGKENRLILLEILAKDCSDIGFTILSYEPVPETRTWRLDHGVDFFYFPPIWVIESAESPGDRKLDTKKMRERVYLKELSHSKVAVAVTCDGLFTVDFFKWEVGRIPDVVAAESFDLSTEEREKAQSLWISVCNVLQVCIFIRSIQHKKGIHRPFPMFPSRTQRRVGINSRGGGGASRAHLGLDGARRPPREGEAGWMDWRIGERSIYLPVSKEVLDDALDTLDSILSMPLERGLRRVEFYASASQHYHEGNFSLALMQAWPVVESLLFELWRGHLEEVNERYSSGDEKLINTPRLKLLTGDKATASVVTALLVTLSILEPRIANRCDKVRQARNSLMHELKTPTRQLALEALELAETLMKQVIGLDLSQPHSVSVGGSAHAID